MTGESSTAAPRTLALVGPTATGKTALAVAVARRLAATELLNADSRQVVRGLHVGTCAPTAAELAGVPCHLLDLRDPGEPFSVADWLAAARAVLEDLDRRGARALVVGGTGLYVSALVDGLDVDGTAPDPEVRRARSELAQAVGGRERLAAELLRRDPDAARSVDLRNPRRVIRALEILDRRGGPLRLARRPAPGGRDAVMVGLDAPRALHDELVERRARGLLLSGALAQEVDSALARGVSRDALDAAGIGYREALAVRDGVLSPEQAVAALTLRTRRYARAQRTWFRRDPRIRWLERGAGAVEALVDEVVDALREDARAGERLRGRG